jgi:hypothetical protein
VGAESFLFGHLPKKKTVSLRIVGPLFFFFISLVSPLKPAFVPEAVRKGVAGD